VHHACKSSATLRAERCADALLARQPPSARTCPLCVAAVTLAMRIFDI
jgi:hypothetical protein